MFETIATVLGWIGMCSLLTAYALRERVSKRTYAVLNLIGAVLVCVVCYATQTWPPFVLNIFWGSIAIKDLVRAGKPPIA